MVRDKVRIRFAKAGDLRLVSHHDLMRCFERMLRRAAIPFAVTGGFHPGPRLVFASALPLGVEGLDEVVELELTDPVEPADVRDRLAAQAPAGLAFHSAERVPIKAVARVRRAVYRFPVPEERRLGLAERCTELLARPELPVERPRPKPRRVDIRPFVNHLRLTDGFLILDLVVSQEGGARADEILDLLGLRDLLDAGAVPVRTTVELHESPEPGSPRTVADRPVPDVTSPDGEPDDTHTRPETPPSTSPDC